MFMNLGGYVLRRHMDTHTDRRTDRVIPKYLLLHVTWFAGDIVMTLLLSLLVLVCVM